jgi:hypothetical protein
MRVPGSSEGENSRTLFQVLQTVRLSQLLDEQLKLRIPLHRENILVQLALLKIAAPSALFQYLKYSEELFSPGMWTCVVCEICGPLLVLPEGSMESI